MPILIRTTGFDQYLDTSQGGSYIRALIMGDHGVGKTPSAACWPQPIIADCENGLASVANKAIPYATIKTSDDMLALVDYCRRDALKSHDKRHHKTLVIDTIDSYQRRLIQQRLKAEQKESLSGWADWGWLDGKMVQLIEALLNLPMHVVVNMHVKDVDDGDEDSKMLVKKARLKGDIKDSIFQDFDLIGLMESSYVQGTGAQQGERIRVRNIRWHAEPRFPSLRDRFNKLPRFTKIDFTEDDFWRIFNYITEGMDSIPETATLEEVATDADSATPPAVSSEKGGPVESPTLPRKATKKTAAKKAAKKAPAKKAAAKPEPEPEADVTGVPYKEPVEDPWQPGEAVNAQTGEVTKPGEPLPEIPADDTAGAVVLVKEKLGAEEVKAEDFTDVASSRGFIPEKPAAKTAKHCGDQPPSMASRGFEAAPGCGRELSPDNASKAQIAVLKAKTYLCDSCFAAFTTK